MYYVVAFTFFFKLCAYYRHFTSKAFKEHYSLTSLAKHTPLNKIKQPLEANKKQIKPELLTDPSGIKRGPAEMLAELLAFIHSRPKSYNTRDFFSIKTAEQRLNLFCSPVRHQEALRCAAAPSRQPTGLARAAMAAMGRPHPPCEGL